MTRFDVSELQKVAKERNLVCLSDVYLKSHTKYEWRCLSNNNHNSFMSSHNNIKTGKQGCHDCFVENNPKKGKPGRKFTETEKSNMSKIAKDKGFGKWMLGRKLSIDTISKLKLSHLGHTTSEETRYKIGIANKGFYNGMFEKNHSLETKKVISDMAKSSWLNPEVRDRILNHPDRILNCRKGALAAHMKIKRKGFKNTKPELDMKKILNDIGIEYKHQFRIMDIEHFYAADFYIEKFNIVLEVDGVYWHNYPHYRPLDLIRIKEMKDNGYNVIRFWEGKFNLNEVIAAINEISEKF
jgi:very-short-patch-repair endonuclease